MNTDLKLTIVLGIFVLIVFVIGIYQEATALNMKTTACSGITCYPVYIQSFERQEMIDYCQLGDMILGCHKIIYSMDKPPVHTIALEIDHEFDYTPLGCTVYQHEILHAWGYNEVMIGQFFPCGQTSIFVNQTLPHTGFWK